MPKYRVEMSWSETVQMSSVVEVEADNEEEAEDLASDRRFDNYDSGDSDSNDDFNVDDITCLTPDPDKKTESQRNLPQWF